MTQPNINALRTRLGELADVQSALCLLEWDQEVYMPPKGAPARGKQLATLSALHHRMLTAPEMGALLDTLEGDLGSLAPDEVRLVEETRYDFDRATKLPESFVRTFAEACSRALEAWAKAREASCFSAFQAHLERIVGLVREKAQYLGYAGSPYNALLEEYERGMTAEELHPLFAQLAERQSALIQRIVEAPQPDCAWLEQTWDEQAQWDFTMRLLGDMGYDLEAGRQDKSVHPFTIDFDVHDVRITNRFSPTELFAGMSGAAHEGGHALYEQGYRVEDRRTVLAQAPSLGIHESQSRMWENLVGRSLPFWRHYLPVLREHFPGQLDAVDADAMYRAINRVRPSFIRVEADECTYNLHVVIRFEIEVDLVEGRLAVADVPAAWNAKVKDYLGLDVPDDARGCLQDIHWSHGALGYFPTYALGNLYAAQLFDQVRQDLPDLWVRVEAGEFSGLLSWLRVHVHRVGRRKMAAQIVENATDKPPSSEPYLTYLETKFGSLYGLS